MATQIPPSVFVLDPYHPDAIALLNSAPEIDLHLPNDPNKSSWKEKADAVLIRSETRITDDDLQNARKLRLIVKQGVGVDNISLDGAKKHNVSVYNTPALNSETVAELAMSLAFALARRVTELDRRFRNGQPLVRSQLLGLSLFGKTVGVIGMGNIGREVAKKFRGCSDCKIVGYDPVAPQDAWSDIPHVRAKTLDELLPQVDVITFHVPLIDSTRGMVGAKQFGMMKETAILINTARGGVVEESALFDALKERRLWGAALDATVIEPPTTDAYRDWLELDNVIITPHVGASTRENQSNSGQAAVRTLLSVLKGDQGVKGKVV